MICQSNFPRRVAQTKHSFTEGALILCFSLSLSLARRVISPCVCVWSQRTLIDIVASGVAAAERAGEREREYNILSIVCVFVRCARECISIKIMRERRRTANI
jgi:hypothetical protein